MTIKLSANIIFHQWLAGLAAALLNQQAGFMIGWSSPATARLTAPDSPLLLDDQQVSWVASLLNFGRLFGAVLGPITAVHLGIKRSISITLFPVAISWITTAFANSAEWLYVARLLGGYSQGVIFSIFPFYVSEVSMPEIRGALVSLCNFGGCLGQVIGSACGAHWSLTTSSVFYLAWCVICMAIFFYIPESPHHLMKVGKRKAAQKSIHWYRAGREVEIELEAVEKFVKSNGTTSFISMLREFKSPAIRKATVQIIILFTFLEICGLNSVMFYMENILKKTNFTLISPPNIVTYVFICSTCASSLSILLIDTYGRRFLLLMSSIGVTIAMLSLMLYFALSDYDKEIKNIEWIPMASMFLFASSYTLGLVTVPNSVLSETLPASVKYIVSCIATLTSSGVAFLSTMSYQPAIDLMGEKYVFLMHALFSGAVIPYVLFVMPETKGKTLQQIQDELMKK